MKNSHPKNHTEAMAFLERVFQYLHMSRLVIIPDLYDALSTIRMAQHKIRYLIHEESGFSK